MPWTAGEFKAKHCHRCTLAQAGRAARIATAMIGRGVDEGTAIATGIKRVRGRSARQRLGAVRRRRGTR